MRKPEKLFVSLAVCLMITLFTAPAKTNLVPLVGVDLGALAGPLVVAWAINSAFTIGASLGQASRGKYLVSLPISKKYPVLFDNFVNVIYIIGL